MGRPAHTTPRTRKPFHLDDEVWDRIARYRHSNFIGTEAEAVRRLMLAALDAAEQPAAAAPGPKRAGRKGKEELK